MQEPKNEPIVDACHALRNNDHFRTIIGFMRTEREMLFSDLCLAEDPNSVMKMAGGISRMTELIAVFDADSAKIV